MAKRPWNRVNLPVYSISSRDKKGNTNMHIITYASQISMKPKRFICGIFHGTKTLSNIEENPVFVLQLLSAQQFRLVDLLGKKSGNQIDKIARLEKRKLLTTWKTHLILQEALAVIQLKVISSFDGGDHRGFVCDMLDYQNQSEGEPLTLDVLREHRIIRI